MIVQGSHLIHLGYLFDTYHVLTLHLQGKYPELFNVLLTNKVITRGIRAAAFLLHKTVAFVKFCVNITLNK